MTRRTFCLSHVNQANQISSPPLEPVGLHADRKTQKYIQTCTTSGKSAFIRSARKTDVDTCSNTFSSSTFSYLFTFKNKQKNKNKESSKATFRMDFPLLQIVDQLGLYKLECYSQTQHVQSQKIQFWTKDYLLKRFFFFQVFWNVTVGVCPWLWFVWTSEVYGNIHRDMECSRMNI